MEELWYSPSQVWPQIMCLTHKLHDSYMRYSKCNNITYLKSVIQMHLVVQPACLPSKLRICYTEVNKALEVSKDPTKPLTVSFLWNLTRFNWYLYYYTVHTWVKTVHGMAFYMAYMGESTVQYTDLTPISF